MKIGILTLKLGTNYGGILQAYALQTVLQRLGHNPVILQRHNVDLYKISLASAIHYCKLAIVRLMGTPIYIPKKQSLETIKRNTELFVNKYFNLSPYLRSTKELREYTKKEGFEAYVVGSDQVWRPRYSPCLSNYYLDFISEQDVKRIAYAASFGVDEWEYPHRHEKKCVPLAKQFDAISVREKSGIYLCRKYLRMEAIHVLDPTLLLSKDDYVKLVNDINEPKKDGTLFCYVLDDSNEMNSVITFVSKSTGYKPFYTMAKRKLNKENERHHLEDCVFPRVTEWLRSFMDAEMVVTDSFHGCVFSIIFNKPFWVVGNKSRGMARFDSLLSMFELQNRMISADNISKIDLKMPIDWNAVEEKKKKLIENSMNFLNQNLNEL